MSEEFNSNYVLNMIMHNHMVNKLRINYPFTWSWGFTYVYEYLKEHQPQMVGVLTGEFCYDLEDNFSYERERIFMAVEWVAEHYKRFKEENIPLDKKSINATICRQIGLPFRKEDIQTGDEAIRPMPTDEDFDFEIFIRSEVINVYGLVPYIATLELFIKVCNSCKRRAHLLEDMIVQNFSNVDKLSFHEQKELAGFIATYAEVYICEGDLARNENTEKSRIEILRKRLNISSPPKLKVVAE